MQHNSILSFFPTVILIHWNHWSHTKHAYLATCVSEKCQIFALDSMYTVALELPDFPCTALQKIKVLVNVTNN